jgi:hypothetical protein
MKAKFSLEGLLVVGAALVAAGLALDGAILYRWLQEPGREMERTIHLAFVATTVVVLGVNLMFSAFLLNLIMEESSDDR